MSILNFDEDDHTLTLAEWLEACDAGAFIDYDGYGDAIIWDGETLTYEVLAEFVYPSDRHDMVPDGTTHIIWYNR